MFTGLIECTGSLVSVRRSGEAAVIELAAPLPAAEISIGDSIAVNGACLTVRAISEGRFSFDASPETIERTTFGSIRGGTLLNLERALKIGSRLDGHLVTGHVDSVGSLKMIKQRANSVILTFSIPQKHCLMLVEKGSVAVDGISLTVSEVDDGSFSVVIIPHTLSKTTLGNISSGTLVNIETDIIGKYLARFAAPYRQAGGLTMETLARNGFI